MILLSTAAPASARVAAAASTSITGTVLNTDNRPVAYAKLRLRNVVTGEIRATAVANAAGQFVFRNIDSGSYIVELVSDDGKILSIGHTVTVGPGETVATFVRTGTRVPWFKDFFGNAAGAIALAAAATGITAIAPDEIRPASAQK